MANVKQEDVFEPKVKIKEEPDFFQKTSVKKEPCQDSTNCQTRQDSKLPSSGPSSSVACSSRRLNVQDNNNESTASVMSDEFGQDFCEWFYTMINRLQPCCANQPGDTLRPEVFCGNCSVEMYLVDGGNVEQCRASGSVETERTIRELLKRLGLMFMPNTKGGMQVRRSSHGMIQLFCCGTIHYNDSFVGIFEQEFGLVASPVDKSWKISYTKVNLKKLLEAYTPSLPTVEIFAIEF
ncbi:uncharacterized protein C3orf38 homolog [Hyalella azteca]|uniref:Uncharacterized protein C3orf38 homolog n=1 Tax=Hyalella azteca TaxID=294128 RepID=A0A979FRA5_HYAAZ|nr:uncharacterized protein C3orf38 homolog [Hyalella azteca]